MTSLTGRLVAGLSVLHVTGIICGLYAGGVFYALAVFGAVMLGALELLFAFRLRAQDDLRPETAKMHTYQRAWTP